MKKYFFICVVALSTAAISTSANNSSKMFTSYVAGKMNHDTVPGKMDTTGRWKNQKNSKDSTDRMKRDSSLRR